MRALLRARARPVRTPPRDRRLNSARFSGTGQAVQKAIEAQRLRAARKIEEVGARQRFDAFQLGIHRRAFFRAGCAPALRTAPPPSRWSSAGSSSGGFSSRRPRSAPRIASHMMILGALGAAQPREIGVPHRRQRMRVALDQLEELHVPFVVVESGALAVHLVRKPAGADDHDLQVLGIGQHRAAHRLAELVAAQRRWAAGAAAR